MTRDRGAGAPPASYRQFARARRPRHDFKQPPAVCVPRLAVYSYRPRGLHVAEAHVGRAWRDIHEEGEAVALTLPDPLEIARAEADRIAKNRAEVLEQGVDR